MGFGGECGFGLGWVRHESGLRSLRLSRAVAVAALGVVACVRAGVRWVYSEAAESV